MFAIQWLLGHLKPPSLASVALGHHLYLRVRQLEERKRLDQKTRERLFLKIAELGNLIEFKDGLQGVVEKVNENSVIVNLTHMENFHELEMEEKTVVNHKNYKIIKQSINA